MRISLYVHLLLRISFVLISAILMSSASGFAELQTYSVRFKGNYDVARGWLLYRVGQDITVVSAAAVAESDSTVIIGDIISNKPRTRGAIELAAVLITTDGRAISSAFSRDGWFSSETTELSDELILLRTRRELLRKTHDELAAQREQLKQQLADRGSSTVSTN